MVGVHESQNSSARSRSGQWRRHFEWTSARKQSGAGRCGFKCLFQRPRRSSEFLERLQLSPSGGRACRIAILRTSTRSRKRGWVSELEHAPLFVTYDSHVDAAKVVIPAFLSPGFNTTLASAMTASETHIVPSGWASYVIGRQVKIDSEIMVVTAYDADAVVPRGFQVARAQYGTVAVPHAVGADLAIAANSLPNQLRPPLQTTDGHTYMFTWDALYTSSFLNTGLAGNKTFQFTSAGEKIWLEVKTRMDGGAHDYVPRWFRPVAMSRESTCAATTQLVETRTGY